MEGRRKDGFVEYCIGVESAFWEELYFSQLYYKRPSFEAMFIQNKPKLTNHQCFRRDCDRIEWKSKFCLCSSKGEPELYIDEISSQILVSEK
jgi:hypothetical protein